MENESLNVLYRDGGILLGEADGKYYYVMDNNTYLLSDYPFEPCLYIKGPGKLKVTVHHAFTVKELDHAARTGSFVTMVTGNEYDIGGLLGLIRKAIELSRETVDIHYVEGHCFMDYMREHGAVSPETAVDPADAGLRRAAMYSFLHSGKVGKTLI